MRCDPATRPEAFPGSTQSRGSNLSVCGNAQTGFFPLAPLALMAAMAQPPAHWADISTTTTTTITTTTTTITTTPTPAARMVGVRMLGIMGAVLVEAMRAVGAAAKIQVGLQQVDFASLWMLVFLIHMSIMNLCNELCLAGWLEWHKR